MILLLGIELVEDMCHIIKELLDDDAIMFTESGLSLLGPPEVLDETILEGSLDNLGQNGRRSIVIELGLLLLDLLLLVGEHSLPI